MSTEQTDSQLLSEVHCRREDTIIVKTRGCGKSCIIFYKTLITTMKIQVFEFAKN